ncbi:MAG: two-component system response regulator [Alkalinema sp. CACIAM 70d]|nr:MAG: two-component system response regulator [Alkalinema sp. CACIAM 70d]
MRSCERSVLRILIADDHELTRFTLKLALKGQPGIELVDVAENGVQAVEMVKRHHPDVVILDMQMPVLDGPGAAAQIKTIAPSVQIMAYSSLEEPRIERLIQEGTIDIFCRKDTAMTEILSKAKLLSQPLVEYPVF